MSWPEAKIKENPHPRQPKSADLKSSAWPRKAADAVAEQQNADAGGGAALKVQDEPPEVVIHDGEAIFKEEDAHTEFIIIDLVDQRAETKRKTHPAADYKNVETISDILT